MKAINNFNLVKKFIEDNVILDEGDYLFIQLILRKKDKITIFGNKNNSARFIKTYQFFNLEQFDSKEREIIELCELFKCRAGINLNKRNEKNITLELLSILSSRIKSNNFRGINGILNTANGGISSVDKYWLIDIDDSPFNINELIEIINSIKPITGNKVKSILPTYNGHHLITTAFDRKEFDKITNSSIQIHKNNPTCLYYPSKNENE